MSIDLPGKIREKLRDWLPDLQNLRYTKQEHLHLTILFLGECNEGESKLIAKKLETVRFDPFQMEIQGIGAFPGRKKPRVIWAGVKKSSELMNLQKLISDKLSAFTDDSSERTFKPHITLARVNKRFKQKKIVQLFETKKSLTVKVNSFSLKKSVLSAEGSVHTTLEKYYSD